MMIVKHRWGYLVDKDDLYVITVAMTGVMDKYLQCSGYFWRTVSVPIQQCVR